MSQLTRYSSNSLVGNPSPWIIFICLTRVLLPDSPAPINIKSRYNKHIKIKGENITELRQECTQK